MAFLDLPSFSAAEIKAIAQYQKRTLIWFALRFIVSGFFVVIFSMVRGQVNPNEPPTASAQTLNNLLMVIHWSFSGIMYFYLFHLAKALRLFSKTWICWAVTILSFLVGILGLIFILGAIIQANRALRAKGIRIGLIGADPVSLAEYLSRSSDSDKIIPASA